MSSKKKRKGEDEIKEEKHCSAAAAPLDCEDDNNLRTENARLHARLQILLAEKKTLQQEHLFVPVMTYASDPECRFGGYSTHWIQEQGNQEEFALLRSMCKGDDGWNIWVNEDHEGYCVTIGAPLHRDVVAAIKKNEEYMTDSAVEHTLYEGRFYLGDSLRLRRELVALLETPQEKQRPDHSRRVYEQVNLMRAEKKLNPVQEKDVCEYKDVNDYNEVMTNFIGNVGGYVTTIAASPVAAAAASSVTSSPG